MSSDDMAKQASDRIEFLQGTLDMLILRTLRFGPAHGHQIARHIQVTTEDVLQVEHGSLYPALHRLERKGLIKAEWHVTENNRKAKYYQLTGAGRKHLKDEAAAWRKLSTAVACVLDIA